jgi:RND family efflux transporter MFP subunit
MSSLADLAAPRPLSGAWLNAGLCTLLVGAAAGAYLTVGSSSSQSAAPRTAQSARGVVLSSVSASGNLQAPSSIAVNFKAAGRLVSVDVMPGQHVAAGQVLGRTDPASAQLAVRSAEASLHSAQAQLKQTLAGETPQQRAQDRVAILQAALSLRTARTTLADTKQSVAQDEKTLATAIAQAEAQLASDQSQLQQDLAQLNTDQAVYNAAVPAVDADKTALASAQAKQQSDQQGQYDAQGAQTTHSSQLSDDQSKLSAAESKLQQDQAACNADPTAPECAQIAGDQALVATYTNAVAADRSSLGSDQSTLTGYQKTLAADSAAVSAAQSKLSDDQATLNTAKSAVTADTNAVHSDQKAITADQNQLANARNSRASGLVKGRQSLHGATQQLSSAVLGKRATATSNAVKQSPAQAGTVAAAEAGVEQAQVNLATANQTLADTVLRAPVAGTVAAVSGIAGQEISASGSGSGTSSTDFVTLTNLSGMQIVAGFSETDVAKLRLGQPATVTVSALPNRQLAARVIAIDTTSTVVSNVVTYNVTFALDNAERRLKPGMTADVSVVVAERDNAVHVPTAAVTGSGANASVTVLRNGKQVSVPVVAGLKGDSSTQIVRGLRAGETVVLPTLSLSNASTGTNGATGGGASRRFGGGGGPAVFIGP